MLLNAGGDGVDGGVCGGGDGVRVACKQGLTYTRLRQPDNSDIYTTYSVPIVRLG